jgi:drug/metabolite transporter (DMT)-like permease
MHRRAIGPSLGLSLRVRVLLLTTAALVGFSANSLLTRSALSSGRMIDPASFTAIRLVTGAVTLLLLVRLRRAPAEASRGSWTSALALAGYAVLFTLAYTRIGAGVGALLLFGAVQITMIATGLVRGERPARIDWLGLALAFAGLVVLTLPGAAAPDLAGSVLMAGAGACWGAYSLAGRGNRDPLGATAGNFLQAAAMGVVFFGVAAAQTTVHVSLAGLLLASASGSLASGVGYTLWYAALPSLASWRAAIVQLTVPVATAIAATLILGESLSTRLVVAAALVATGVWLTVWPKGHLR